MDDRLQARIRSVFSYAVKLVDTYTKGEPIRASLVVRLADHRQAPVSKGDGWYIFTDLPDGCYTLLISSREYIDCDVHFEVTAGQQTRTEQRIYLQPSPAYPFRTGDSLIRGRAIAEDGSPAGGACVGAVLSYEGDALVKLAEDAAKGATELTVQGKKGQAESTDLFLLQTSALSGTIIRFAGPPKGRVYPLTEPLSIAYPRGSLFFPFFETHCDERGEFVVALPLFLDKTNAHLIIEVWLNIATGFVELPIHAGTTQSAGVIRLKCPD